MIALLLLAAIGGGIAYWQYQKTRHHKFEAAQAANARGIGYLDFFDTKLPDETIGYENAQREFAEAMRLAPEWLPAKIHYGMSTLYAAKDPLLDKPILDQATAVFQDVLKLEPDNPYANYCLGLIFYYRGEPEIANPYFIKVTDLDPQDPHSWYFRGMTTLNSADSPQARDCFEKATALDPYLTNARYSFANHSLTDDPQLREKLHRENDELKLALWSRTAEIKPTKLGRYGSPIGSSSLSSRSLESLPAFEQTDSAKVTLEANTSWAAAVDGPAKMVRERFGGTLVRLDIDGDGRPDLLLLSAVTRNGKVGDLLLHNDGGGKFSDATTAAGLAGQASLGAAVADFDNSGTPDLLLTTGNGVKLFRNLDGKAFEDVTALAGLDKLAGTFLPAAWVDLDQDGDLDPILGKHGPDGKLFAFLNVGEAPPGPANQTKPLSVKFQPFESPAFAISGPISGLLVSDLDADGDADLVAFVDGKLPSVILNDRLLRFHSGSPIVEEAANWNGGTTIDVNGDGQSDLVLVSTDKKPIVLSTTDDRIATDTKRRFRPLITDSSAIVQAQPIDIDHDGRTDLLGLSAERKPVLLRGDGDLRLAAKPFGDAPNAIADLLAAAGGDFDGDCHNDLVCWSAAGGVKLYRNLGNGNRGLRVQLSGKRESAAFRTNLDAVGAKVVSLTGSIHTLVENATLGAGLGQSRLPLDFGIGQAATADAIRIAWPDMIPQAEVNLPACELRLVRETDRRPDSCPVLFTWDGEKYRYVTDLLGEGTMGELNATGGTRPPRPEESVKIEANQLKPRDGRYLLKLAEPMNEILYLDRLQLDAVDHAADAEVYPDERFAAGAAPPTQKLLSFRTWFAPVKASDHRGRDVLETLKARDGKHVDTFQRRPWLGLAEEHAVELDFGDRMEKLASDSPLYLVLAGWTDYAYPETLFAATQAGVTPLAPTLEKRVGDGPWEAVGEIGFPAGLPRTMTSPVKGLAGSRSLKLRIRTNMHVFWDQIRLGVAEPAEPAIHAMPAAKATLDRRGFAREIRPKGFGPAAYDDSQYERVTYTKWRGRLTKLGDVTELLSDADDRFAILGPGDEVAVEFDAAMLPAIPAGLVRSFVLRANGYCKDSAPFTATTGDILPLPFRAMASYPDGARDRSKAPQGQDNYDRTWNTRPVGGR